MFMASNIFYVATLCNPVNAGSVPDVIWLAFLTFEEPYFAAVAKVNCRFAEGVSGTTFRFATCNPSTR